MTSALRAVNASATNRERAAGAMIQNQHARPARSLLSACEAHSARVHLPEPGASPFTWLDLFFLPPERNLPNGKQVRAVQQSRCDPL